MKSRQTGLIRTHLLALERGESVVDGILAYAREHRIESALISGIGAVADVEIGAFDVGRMAYDRLQLQGDREVLSLTGNIAIDTAGEPVLHAHVVLGDPEGRTAGGHLFSAVCAVTVELSLFELAAPILREHDEFTGLSLWSLGS